MDAVLEIAGLRESYRGRKVVRGALDGFDMVVGAGQVHGFLGPNGSGKTTTLRTLLGLIKPNGGRTAILWKEGPPHLPATAGVGGGGRGGAGRSWRARSSSATSAPRTRCRCWPTRVASAGSG